MGAIQCSNYIADLILVEAGEEQAVRHPSTRRAWHFFFFLTLVLVIWHFVVRLAVAPSFTDSLVFVKSIRLVEACIYAMLICALGIVACSHYQNLLLPGRHSRFITLCFLFGMAVLLFARLNYSLFNYNPLLFVANDTRIVPVTHFGMHGFRDLQLFLECLEYSSCAILNRSFSGLVPTSPLIVGIAVIETMVGYAFFAIMIATFVQVKAQKSIGR